MKTGRTVFLFLTAAVCFCGCGKKKPAKVAEKKAEGTQQFEVVHHDRVNKSFLSMSPWNLLLLLADRLDPSSREVALCEIAASLAEAGNVPQALKIADQMDSVLKTRAILGISQAMAEVKDLQKAISLINQLDGRAKKQAMHSVAVAMAESNNVPQSMVIAEQLEGYDRARAMNAIVEALLKAGKIDAVKGILPQVMSASLAKSIESSDRIEVLCSLAQEFAEMGNAKYSEGVLSEAITLSNQLESPQRELGGIAAAMARCGNSQRAIEIAHILQDQAWVLSQISVAMTKAGDLEGAFHVTADLQGAKKTGTLRQMAEVLVEADKKDEALKILNDLSDSPQDSPELLGDIAITFAQAGDVQKAISIANGFQNTQKVWVLREIALTSAKQGNTSYAFELLTQALSIIDTLSRESSSYNNVYDLYKIAQALVKVDISQQNQTFSKEGQTVADTIINQVVIDQQTTQSPGE